MALNVPSFDDLRIANEKALAKAGHSWDASNLPDRHGRLRSLIERRAEIEDLASTQSQREEYGVKRWHADFVRLRDVDETLRERLWNAMPDCRFKRFQEAFSHPHQRIVPEYSDEGGSIRFPTVDFSTLSVHACLVSADLISSPLIRSLQLGDDLDTWGDPLDRLRNRQLDTVQRLKKIWDSAESLQQANRRIMVVRESDPVLDFEYAGTPPIGSAIEGSIIYTRERMSGSNGPFRSRTVQIFESAGSADRKTAHEQDVYSQEMALLVGLEDQLTNFNRRLDRDWRNPDAREELRTEAQSLLSQGADALASCENRYKVEAQRMLEAASLLKDSRGRENITMVMTRMVAIVQRLQNRMTEMIGKGTFNEADSMAIERAIGRDASTIGKFRTAVEQAPGKLNVVGQLFNGSPLSPVAHDAAIDGIRRMMRLDFQSLDKVLLRPNRQFALLLSAQDRPLQDALVARDRVATDDALVRMHVIGKFQEIELMFEHILHEIMNPRVAVDHLIEEIAVLRHRFTAYQLLPQHVVLEYVEPVAQMKTTLVQIEERLKFYAMQNLNTQDRAVVYARLGNYLKTINVLELAGSVA